MKAAEVWKWRVLCVKERDGKARPFPSHSALAAVPPHVTAAHGEGFFRSLDALTDSQYDGYETFSIAPPSVSASYGASGPMDPPQPDDMDVNIVGGMAARLGLAQQRSGMGGMELMERLGLGDGTRVVDLQVSVVLHCIAILTKSTSSL